MNTAPLFDYFFAAFNAASAALLLCGVGLVLGCQFLGVARGRGDSEGTEERNHAKEVT